MTDAMIQNPQFQLFSIDEEESMRSSMRESEDDRKIRKDNEKEILELWTKKEEGAASFLKYCSEKYKNWKNQKVEISEDDLKDAKIK